MKLYKSIFKAFAALMAVVTVASCAKDDYEPTPIPENAQVYFSNVGGSTYLLEENQNTVMVEVLRINKEGEITIGVEATDTNNVFTVAKSVTFADGDSIARIPVTFKFSDLTPDTDYPLTLSILSETIPYGESVKNVIIKYAPWSDWAPYGWSYPSKMSFDEWETLYETTDSYTALAKGGEDGLPVYHYEGYVGGDYAQFVFIRNSMLNPSQCQIMLYDWGYGINLVINWDKNTNEYSVPHTYFTNNTNYGSVYVSDTYTYWSEYRGDDKVTKEQFPSYFDAENGRLQLNLAYYVAEGYFAAGPGEYIQFPGYEKADYSLTLEAAGLFSSDDKLGEVINFELGEDLGSVKYATFEGVLSDDEIAENAAAIFSGDVESTLTKESGYKVVEAPAGDYTLVAVLYDVDGAQVGVESVNFTITSPRSWSEYKIGDYTYSVFFTDENDEPSVDPGLTLYQCNEDPTLFRIEHWGYDVNFAFTMDEKGNILVNNQVTGYEHPSYGMVMVDDIVDAYESTDYGVSYLEGNTFNFAVVYYVSAGVFGRGMETFTVTESQAKAIRKAIAQAKAEKKVKTRLTVAGRPISSAKSRLANTVVTKKLMK